MVIWVGWPAPMIHASSRSRPHLLAWRLAGERGAADGPVRGPLRQTARAMRGALCEFEPRHWTAYSRLLLAWPRLWECAGRPPGATSSHDVPVYGPPPRRKEADATTLRIRLSQAWPLHATSQAYPATTLSIGLEAPLLAGTRRSWCELRGRRVDPAHCSTSPSCQSVGVDNPC